LGGEEEERGLAGLGNGFRGSPKNATVVTGNATLAIILAFLALP